MTKTVSEYLIIWPKQNEGILLKEKKKQLIFSNNRYDT